MQRTFMGPPPTTMTNANALNCTANDIRLSRATNVSPTSCIAGTTIPLLTATFEVSVTANTRYDAGFFFRVDGEGSARGDGPTASGTCSLSVLTPDTDPTTPALNLDGDTCGDLNSGTFNVTFQIPNVECKAAPGTNLLRLPNCTSWHSNQGTTCTAPATGTDSHVFDVDPDTKSKCVCDDLFTIPVTVETATITVAKSASPTSVSETGGTVTYTVQVTNDASAVTLTIDSIIDDLYGNLGTNPPPQGVTDNDCPSKIGTVLQAGGSTSCSFKAFVLGNSGGTVTDIVEVCGHDNAGHSNICGEDDADVHITDVATAPTLAKTAQSSANCQLDVTYQVVVNNNSPTPPGDTLTVNTLTDNKFGDITTQHLANQSCAGFATCEQVVTTTCSLPKPAIAAGGNLTCTFVGRITSTSCSFTHTDNVTANVTDSDGVNTPALTDPDGGASVTVSTTP
jgi:hypothetical protein